MRNNKVSPAPSSVDDSNPSAAPSAETVSAEKAGQRTRISLVDRFLNLFKGKTDYVSKHGYLEVHHVSKSRFGRQSLSRGRTERNPKLSPRQKLNRSSKKQRVTSEESLEEVAVVIDDKTRSEIIALVKGELQNGEWKTIEQKFAAQTKEKQRLERKFTRKLREKNKEINEIKNTMADKSDERSKGINQIKYQAEQQSEKHQSDHNAIIAMEKELREELEALRKNVAENEKKLEKLLNKKKELNSEAKHTSSEPVPTDHGCQKCTCKSDIFVTDKICAAGDNSESGSSTPGSSFSSSTSGSTSTTSTKSSQKSQSKSKLSGKGKNIPKGESTISCTGSTTSTETSGSGSSNSSSSSSKSEKSRSKTQLAGKGKNISTKGKKKELVDKYRCSSKMNNQQYRKERTFVIGSSEDSDEENTYDPIVDIYTA